MFHMTVHVLIKTQRLVSFRFCVCGPRFNFILSYYILNFFLLYVLWNYENTELPLLAEVCYMVDDPLGIIHAIPSKKKYTHTHII